MGSPNRKSHRSNALKRRGNLAAFGVRWAALGVNADVYHTQPPWSFTSTALNGPFDRWHGQSKFIICGNGHPRPQRLLPSASCQSSWTHSGAGRTDRCAGQCAACPAELLAQGRVRLRAHRSATLRTPVDARRWARRLPCAASCVALQLRARHALRPCQPRRGARGEAPPSVRSARESSTTFSPRPRLGAACAPAGADGPAFPAPSPSASWRQLWPRRRAAPASLWGHAVGSRHGGQQETPLRLSDAPAPRLP
jgi:hypothetical protein